MKSIKLRASIAFLTLVACGGTEEPYQVTEPEPSPTLSTAGGDVVAPEDAADGGSVQDAGSDVEDKGPAPRTSKLTITIKKLRNDRGVVYVALFSDEKGFDSHRPIRGGAVPISERTAQIVFGNLPSGEYGISFFHDENKNGVLDSNLLGIPTEGFGFSNDAMGLFGPPGFSKVVFPYRDDSSEIVLHTRYF